MSNGLVKKRVLVPICNRAHLGRLRPVLRAIKAHPRLELQLMVASSAADDYFWFNLKHSRPHSWQKSLPAYLRARLLSWASHFKPEMAFQDNFIAQVLISDGFQINSQVPFFFDGGLPETMVKSVGLGLIGLADELRRLNPDIVFVNADRFEMMAVATAAALLGIPIAQNEAGDVSGTIDESVRHAITKLAHIHFTSTETSRRRVLRMGEDPDLVFAVGSPAIDAIKNLDINRPFIALAEFNIKNPFLLVLLHPVTTETSVANQQMAENLIAVVKELKVSTIFLGSNIDAMSAQVGKHWRRLKADVNKNDPSHIFIVKHLPPDDFYIVLANASCAVGNSSSFIRESAYFGTPVVLVGSRQQNRERGSNAIEAGVEPKEIKKSIAKQLEHGRYQQDERFGDGQSSQKIAELLVEINPKIQKKFYDTN